MVWMYKISSIVMLCGINEDGRLACDSYFPDPALSTAQMRIGNDFELLFEGVDKTNDFYWVRKFSLKNLKEEGAPTRIVFQYHVSP
jgi:hypothetical protein